ncbi:MAG: hypothetical protein GTO18_19115 [Anaerolineales bacterium]|nr:hypothetical protein [Anaerolineales bacterium]
MTRARDALMGLVLLMILTAAACSSQDAAEQARLTEAYAEMEIQTFEAQTALAESSTQTEEASQPTEQPPSPTITLTPTITHTPTRTLTPTPAAPLISVTANTNCRSGPGTGYDIRGVLLVDEITEVIAKSTIEDYWYIVNPDKPEEACWLSGFYANIEGETNFLPVLTPMPSPTPPVGFDLFLTGFASCGEIHYVVFAVENTGGEILKSANIKVVNYETGRTLYGPTFQRFPFALRPRPVCPPGHGNILSPGVVEYIHVPIDPVPHGSTAHGTVTLCTEDFQGGVCTTRTIYFVVQ